MKELVARLIYRRTKINFISVSIGFVYLWFGMLKFFAGVSPAEDIAKATIEQLTFGILTPEISIILLAVWETLIGLFLIGHLFVKFALKLALIHMILTFLPFLFFPDLVFSQAPFGLTLLGQYIIKNVIILGVLVVLLKESNQGRT
ncbi:MAG: doxx family protein [Eudoraea sp.]|nr:doxx family protein [Eudoraea sp.]